MAKHVSFFVTLLILSLAGITASGAAPDSVAIKTSPSSSADQQKASNPVIPAKDTAQNQAPQQGAGLASKDTTEKTPSVAAPPASAKPAVVQKKKPVEEDLEEELLPEEGAPAPAKAEPQTPAAAAAKTDTGSAKAAAVLKQADTSKAAGPGAAPVPAAAGAAAEPGKTALPAAGPVPDTSKRATVQKTVVPVRIEEPRPINFARNLKDYRSPKLAMFLSLMVPGLGQAYVKSYVKAGLFIAAEAAIIGASVVYSNKGSNKYNQAKAFADRNYSVPNMNSYYTQLLSYLGNDTTAQNELGGIYYDTVPNANSSLSQGYKAKSHAYYTLIAQPEYIQGWKDCQPTLSQIQSAGVGQHPLKNGITYTVDSINTYQVDINGTAVYCYSDSQMAYQTMISQSNSDYKIATNILFIILVNHIVSAVDALISARIYNDELLGKQSFWNHIELEPSVASAGTLSGPAVTLRIKF